MTIEEEQFFELDFVYCGLVYSENKMSISLAVIQENGQLKSEAFYPHKKNRERHIGGIYSGASFSENKVMGLDGVNYKGNYFDTESIIKWRARNDAAKTKERSLKLEKDAKKMNELVELLKPIRKLYSNYRKQNDNAGLEALEAAVLRALRTPLRQLEAD